MINLAFDLVLDSLFKFSKDDLRDIYSEKCKTFDYLPKNGFQEVIDEIEEHSGLFIQSGIDSYEFPHKSLQEFLASEYLVRYSPLDDFKDSIVNIPHELAIVVALSTNPNDKLIEILGIILNSSIKDFSVFMNTFLLRLETEEPSFRPDYKTAIDLSKLWDKTTHKFLYDFAKKVYCLKGIKECYKNVDKHYKLDTLIIHSLMNQTRMPNEDELVEIHSKNINDYIKSTKIYFKFLEDWLYVSPYLIQSEN